MKALPQISEAEFEVMKEKRECNQYWKTSNKYDSAQCL